MLFTLIGFELHSVILGDQHPTSFHELGRHVPSGYPPEAVAATLAYHTAHRELDRIRPLVKKHILQR